MTDHNNDHDKKSWEELRQSVADQNNKKADERTGLERRLASLETRLQTLELNVVKELGQLSVSYQHMATSFDKLVTRAEHDALRVVVNMLVGGVSAGVIGAIFFRLVLR